MAEVLESMGLIFNFIFTQLANFITTILTGTILGEFILAGIGLSFLGFLIYLIFSFAHKN